MKAEDELSTVIIIPEEPAFEISVEAAWKITLWYRFCSGISFVFKNPKWLLEWVTLLLVLKVLWTSGWNLDSILGIIFKQK